jgi:hypothetical protein
MNLRPDRITCNDGEQRLGHRGIIRMAERILQFCQGCNVGFNLPLLAIQTAEVLDSVAKLLEGDPRPVPGFGPRWRKPTPRLRALRCSCVGRRAAIDGAGSSNLASELPGISLRQPWHSTLRRNDKLKRL